MEELFEATLRFLFEFVLEFVCEIIGEVIFELPSTINHQVNKTNFSADFSFSDEIIKLDIYK